MVFILMTCLIFIMAFSYSICMQCAHIYIAPIKSLINFLLINGYLGLILSALFVREVLLKPAKSATSYGILGNGMTD
jgi:uncharacterized integral membrane protein